jgi:hypothetical protein
MMHIGSGKRDEWEFEYTASKLAEGATAQKAHRLSRVEWWKQKKAEVMAEVKESGLEISESIAAQSNYSTSALGGGRGPQISVRADLQQKLGECQSKIAGHTQAAAEYDGWVQVLSANPEARLKLTQADWLYFFGKV